MAADTEIEALSRHFHAAPTMIFGTSPLYQALCPAVAADLWLLGLLTRRRPGQQASFLLFAAVHYLLLDDAEHPLRAYYPSLAPESAPEHERDTAPDPAEAAAPFIDFCHEFREPLEELIGTRLVQSNVIRRAVALRYALWAIGRRCEGPVHLVEVGASAGLLMNVDRYGYLIGDRRFGEPGAPVLLDSEWRGSQPVPDLDAVPRIASKTGVDLNPIDLADARERLWLRALMWPEQHAAAALLQAAIEHAREHPLTVLAGDAIDACVKLARDLPADEPRVVFHAAVRMHVPKERRDAFDDAVDSLGANGPLYHVWLEPHEIPHHRFPVAEPGVIAMHGPGDDTATALARVDGHLHWIESAN